MKFDRINEKLDRIKVLDRFTLKMIAVVSMLMDHIGAVLFPDAMWLRCIGRIAMPIFCFFIAEGIYHTHDRYAYMIRMGLFAILAEVPFDLALYGKINWEHQNVMCTFFLAIVAVLLFNEVSLRLNGRSGKIVGGIVVFIICVTATFLGTDYGIFGVGLVFIFYILRSKGLLLQNLGSIIFHAFAGFTGIQALSIFSSCFLIMYNGKSGRSAKWFFYCFYPCHLLLLWLIKIIVF